MYCPIKAAGWTHNFKASIFGTCSSFYTAISKFLHLLLQQWVQCVAGLWSRQGCVQCTWNGQGFIKHAY